MKCRNVISLQIWHYCPVYCQAVKYGMYYKRNAYHIWPITWRKTDQWKMKSRLRYHTRSVLRKCFWLYTRRSIGKIATASEHLQKEWWLVWIRVCGEHIPQHVTMTYRLITWCDPCIHEYFGVWWFTTHETNEITFQVGGLMRQSQIINVFSLLLPRKSVTNIITHCLWPDDWKSGRTDWSPWK